MRLLNVHDFTFAKYYSDENRPKYAIASHRWNSVFEATFQDVQNRRNTEGLGYQKVRAFAKYVQDFIPSVDWLWVDTCCIDQTNAAELSEAVNLMFEWYRNAEICLAYLADVAAVEDKIAFRQSEWFTRGWTLQELLAPRIVVFLAKTWDVIGNKGGSTCLYDGASIGPSLEQEVAAITKVPELVLRSYKTSLNLSVDKKLKWMDNRRTTREEDMSYALYGIFDVSLGANYGENQHRARERLLGAIRQRENLAAEQAERFKKIVDRLLAPDPWTNHETARKHHEPETGAWLLRSDQYKAWKLGSIKHLWIYGKAGCGKTILCSTAVEDIRAYCKTTMNVGQVIFYFSFSDSSKQTFDGLVRSMVVQLGWKEPGLSLLRQAYESPSKVPGMDELHNIMLACIAPYDRVFLHLDALDECLTSSEGRLNAFSRTEDLLRSAPNIHMLVMSRDVPSVRSSIEKLGAQSISIANRIVDSDIERYVSTQLSRDWKLSQYPAATKEMIKKTFAEKANGMFRWAYCQLEELKGFQSTKPKAVKAALLALPATLDETYERMLTRIKQDDRLEALTLLRWITYAQSPRTLGELAEASIVDPTDDPAADGVVDTENRGSWVDTLAILGGLVVVYGTEDDNADEETDELNVLNGKKHRILGGLVIVYGTEDDNADEKTDELNVLNGKKHRLDSAHSYYKVEKGARIRLAHFSVQEYLESARVLESDAKGFHLDPSREHKFIAQSCLVYLIHYSNSLQNSSAEKSLAALPLAEYAAESWFYHSSLQQPKEVNREILFLESLRFKRDWLHIHRPDATHSPFEKLIIGPGLYYASFLGLEAVVEELLERGSDSNAFGGSHGTALQAAAHGGHETILRGLLERGANVNDQGGPHGNALLAASFLGHEGIVGILLHHGAQVEIQRYPHGSALRAASLQGHETIVQMLLGRGANINTTGEHGTALQAAIFSGHTEIVKLLLERGADVNVQGGRYGNALSAALCGGYGEVVKLLLERGANVNAQGGDYGNALSAVSYGGHGEAVKLLLERGANVNAQGGNYGNALSAASYEGHGEVVKLLLERGANVNALSAASYGGDGEVVKLLLERGANVNARGGKYGTALQAATYGGHKHVQAMLIANCAL